MGNRPDAPGNLLEAMVSGEWLRIGELCEPDARLRAALPNGVFEHEGRAAITDAFRSWYGKTRLLACVAAERDDIGPKTRLRWRVEVAVDWDRAPHLIEQVCFTEGHAALRGLELACSGFVLNQPSRR